MILGIGNDIIDIRRVERTLNRFGDRFVYRVYTETERIKSDARANRAASYAKRFAAKEACAKALGTGISQGVRWQDIGVINHPGGQPALTLSGRARERLITLTPKGYRSAIHVTITDNDPLAQAFVIISADPEEGEAKI